MVAVGLSFPGSSVDKESACSAGDLDSIPGWGRSLGERNGYYYGLNSVQVILLQMATTIGRYFMPNALPSPFFTLEVKVKSAQSCLTLYSPMDSPWTAHRILQARILVVIPFSTGSSQPRDRIQVSCTAGRFFTSRATREAL